VPFRIVTVSETGVLLETIEKANENTYR
jgi:hypothetical protein